MLLRTMSKHSLKLHTNRQIVKSRGLGGATSGQKHTHDFGSDETIKRWWPKCLQQKAHHSRRDQLWNITYTHHGDFCIRPKPSWRIRDLEQPWAFTIQKFKILGWKNRGKKHLSAYQLGIKNKASLVGGFNLSEKDKWNRNWIIFPRYEKIVWTCLKPLTGSGATKPSNLVFRQDTLAGECEV